MHYLVTGGAGFIGSHLVQALLQEGHTVTVLDDLSSGKRDNLPMDKVAFIEGDITTAGIYDNSIAHVDGCFHLAAIVSVQRSIDEMQRTHEVNLTGTVALFDAIQKQQKKTPVVCASSAAVYGNVTSTPQIETDACLPVSPYGTDKLGCEGYARSMNAAFGIPAACMRFFNVYGPNQDASSPYSGVISLFQSKMQQHQPISIYGDGKQTRDFVYVADVVRALMLAMKNLHAEKTTFGIFNVCSAVSTSVNELAALLQELTQSRSETAHQEGRSGEVRHSLGDATLCHKTLGFTAVTSLRDGLQKTLME